jgi:hypothetical protein
MTRHLIHIGFPKAGSTFLQHWFEAHPQIAYAKGGIAGIEGAYGIVYAALSPAVAQPWRVTSAEGLTAPLATTAAGTRGDEARRPASSAEAQARVCALLASLFSDATILIVTRGFRSMILSSYSQYVRAGGTLSLADMVGAALHYQPWDYDEVIRLYEEAFGADSVIVFPYELLADDPASFLNHLERRMSLDPAPVSLGAVNASLSPGELAWYPRLGRLAARLPLARRLAVRLAARAASSNRLGRAIRVLQKLHPLPPVSAASLDEDLIRGFSGRAERLRGRPLYADCSDAYLL